MDCINLKYSLGQLTCLKEGACCLTGVDSHMQADTLTCHTRNQTSFISIDIHDEKNKEYVTAGALRKYSDVIIIFLIFRQNFMFLKTWI